MNKQSAHCFGRAGRLTGLLLAVLVAAGLMPVSVRAAEGGSHFADVPSSHWAFQYVERAYEDGAIVGTGGDPAEGTGEFSPDLEMTYGQFLTMLMNAFYPDEMAKASPQTPWYAPAVQVAADHQLTYISQDDLMNKYANFHINRYNMSWILVKLLEDKGAELPSQQERDAAAAKIADWDTVGTDHKSWPYYVSSVVAAGIISGVDDNGTFNGSGYVSRGAAAVIYTKLADKLREESGQTPGTDPGQNTDIRQEYQIVYGEGWDLITVPDYRADLEEAFYETYPRVVARWGAPNVQKTIPFHVREKLENESVTAFMWTTYVEYDQQAKLWERAIEISAASQNKRPASWAITHELTHVVQSYNNFKATWWVECMASYSQFRYCSWADEKYLDLENYYQQGDAAQHDWKFEAYGGSWFFAYMDAKYPTTPAGRGLIDAIHFGIKDGQITSDDPNDPNLNAVVKRITGYSTIEQLRQQYVRELDAGTWTFNGFAGYADNYITENIPGVPNPTYPTGVDFNFCAGASTYSVSGEASVQLAANNLVDGNRSTKWEAAKSDVTDRENMNRDTEHDLCIRLRKSVTFNTYTLYHEGSQKNGQENTVSWRVRYYDDQTESWKTFDEVKGNTQDVTTREVKPVTAQFLWLEVLNSSGTGDGTVRLYELELYNKG